MANSMTDWFNYFFPAKKVLKKASGEDAPAATAAPAANIDIGAMAQKQADDAKAKAKADSEAVDEAAKKKRKPVVPGTVGGYDFRTAP